MTRPNVKQVREKASKQTSLVGRNEGKTMSSIKILDSGLTPFLIRQVLRILVEVIFQTRLFRRILCLASNAFESKICQLPQEIWSTTERIGVTGCQMRFAYSAKEI